MATGDGTYITVEEVRVNAGYFDTDTMSDSRIGTIISAVENEVEKYLNTALSPKARVDILDGNGLDRIFLSKNPVLRINSITSDGDTITPSKVHLYPQSGMVVLGDDAEVGSFVVEQKSVIVEYIYGYLHESSTSTTTTASTSAGTSVALSVNDESGFAVGDWVMIYGTDGHREGAEITSTGTGSITVDKLVYSHASSSKVVLLETLPTAKEYMIVESAIRLITAVIGLTSTETTSYTLGDFSATKGEPYAQWNATLRALKARKEDLKIRLRPRPVTMA